MKKLIPLCLSIIIATSSCTKYDGDRGILIDPNGRTKAANDLQSGVKEEIRTGDDGCGIDPYGRN